MLATSVLTLLLSVTTLTSGFSVYQNRIPNGGQVPHPCKPNYLWRGVGHTNPLGGGDRNAFGVDFLDKELRTLCEKDSDGDGMTNGMELGDPDCTWTEGGLPTRVSSITHPGVCEPYDSPTCNLRNTLLECDVAAFECDALKKPDTQNVTLRFPRTSVPNTETNYMCMTFDLPGDDEYHLVATEPYIDNAQVMHHILVYACTGGDSTSTIDTPTQCGMASGNGCDNLIALWTVGIAGTCIQNMTGFKFGRGEFTRVRMEFHWNNPELRSDYSDASGMTFFYTKQLRPYSAATLMVGQAYIEIPPRQPVVEVIGVCDSGCSRQLITEKLYVIEGINHMHYLGKSQKVEVFRDGALKHVLTNDEAYSYDSPIAHIHDPPIELLPGDEIKTTCSYNSQYRNTTTYYGDATSAEMCFAFFTVFPRTALPYTTSCIGYREFSPCHRFETPTGVDGCELNRFLNQSDPVLLDFAGTVMTSCPPFEPCSPECQRVVIRWTQHPCLQGENLETLKRMYLQSKEGTQLIAGLYSCMAPKPQCPRCPKCPTGSGNNDGSRVNDDTGSAAVAVPGIVTIATLLMAALL